MPTTILDGETLEQAYARRFREEAEIDARATCKHEYITTYVDADGEPGGLWGCRDCKARFASLADQIATEKQRDELLAAAELVLAWYEAEEDHSKEPDFYKLVDMCRESEIAIRAAIAKVKQP